MLLERWKLSRFFSSAWRVTEAGKLHLLFSPQSLGWGIISNWAEVSGCWEVNEGLGRAGLGRGSLEMPGVGAGGAEHLQPRGVGTH